MLVQMQKNSRKKVESREARRFKLEGQETQPEERTDWGREQGDGEERASLICEF